MAPLTERPGHSAYHQWRNKCNGSASDDYGVVGIRNKRTMSGGFRIDFGNFEWIAQPLLFMGGSPFSANSHVRGVPVVKPRMCPDLCFGRRTDRYWSGVSSVFLKATKVLPSQKSIGEFREFVANVLHRVLGRCGRR